MDWQKVAIAILTAAAAVLSITGAINTEESGTLVTTGTAAISGIGGFVVAIHSIIKARKEKKD